ncbi:hypothetical protein ACLOJK_008799 [Asimina triloba]
MAFGLENGLSPVPVKPNDNLWAGTRQTQIIAQQATQEHNPEVGPMEEPRQEPRQRAQAMSHRRFYELERLLTNQAEPDVVEGETVAYFLNLRFQSNGTRGSCLGAHVYVLLWKLISATTRGAGCQAGAARLGCGAVRGRNVRRLPSAPMHVGWSPSCAPPKLPSSCTAGAANFYRIDGVEHFVSSNVEGKGLMKEEECREKCSMDFRRSKYAMDIRVWVTQSYTAH